MKIVVVGPAGTPYENGLFLFDLFCPQTYPHDPPMVKFRGTGGGRVRLNPNLHSDGKVCLSLLGTWEGEPWRPMQSTILQVLICIQAMILCDDPFCNEPIFLGKKNSPQGQSYILEVRSLTVRFAMLDLLENPPQLWRELVMQHFRSKKSSILNTIAQWEQQATNGYGRKGPPHYLAGLCQPMENLAVLKPTLQAALQNPGSGSGQRLGGSSQQVYGHRGGQHLGGSGQEWSRYGGGSGGYGSRRH